jgi:hypothetical protein
LREYNRRQAAPGLKVTTGGEFPLLRSFENNFMNSHRTSEKLFAEALKYIPGSQNLHFATAALQPL